MDEQAIIEKNSQYFLRTLQEHGATPKGVDYNSEQSQEIRFQQLIRMVDSSQSYSLIDYGCGYGGMFAYLLKMKHSLIYYGYDLLEPMVTAGKALYEGYTNCHFTAHESDLSTMDYVVESGIFNYKFPEFQTEDWTGYILKTLQKMFSLAEKGMAFNMLTSYSDADRKRPNLYYGDPCFFFDYCKCNFSRNVALLHDYELYDFTILVKK